jgi:hypothetical protein
MTYVSPTHTAMKRHVCFLKLMGARMRMGTISRTSTELENMFITVA